MNKSETVLMTRSYAESLVANAEEALTAAQDLLRFMDPLNRNLNKKADCGPVEEGPGFRPSMQDFIDSLVEDLQEADDEDRKAAAEELWNVAQRVWPYMNLTVYSRPTSMTATEVNRRMEIPRSAYDMTKDLQGPKAIRFVGMRPDQTRALFDKVFPNGVNEPEPMSDVEVAQAIIDIMGERSRFRKMAEECSELAHACLKYDALCSDSAPQEEILKAKRAIIHELVDVFVLIQQVSTVLKLKGSYLTEAAYTCAKAHLHKISKTDDGKGKANARKS